MTSNLNILMEFCDCEENAQIFKAFWIKKREASSFLFDKAAEIKGMDHVTLTTLRDKLRKKIDQAARIIDMLHYGKPGATPSGPEDEDN